MYNFCSEDDLIIIQLENKSWPQLSASIDSGINYSAYKCYKNSQSNTVLCWSHQEASMKGMGLKPSITGWVRNRSSFFNMWLPNDLYTLLCISH